MDDMEKLRPDADLNDTIVGNYIKLLQISYFTEYTNKNTHIFSSFFLEKLIGDFTK